MSIKNSIKRVTGPTAILGVVAGAIMGVVTAGSAFSSVEGTGAPGVTCEYTLQLLGSLSIRNSYVAKVIELGGVDLGGAGGASPVEAMYAGVQKVSYDDTPSAPASTDLWRLGLGKTASQAATLDPLSMECLGCHDGSAASAIHVDARNDPFGGPRVSSFRSDHPVGMYYASYVAAGRGYKQVLPGSNRMVFVNGKVGCLTCHNPLNPEPGHLVMSDRNSALCLTCHHK
jgi:predicted CXXCH cytochrome family protein